MWVIDCVGYVNSLLLVFFFFQAEDGIRDHCVTGVQTCALPISMPAAGTSFECLGGRAAHDDAADDQGK